jgi:hypothetical protein
MRKIYSIIYFMSMILIFLFYFSLLRIFPKGILYHFGVDLCWGGMTENFCKKVGSGWVIMEYFYIISGIIFIVPITYYIKLKNSRYLKFYFIYTFFFLIIVAVSYLKPHHGRYKDILWVIFCLCPFIIIYAGWRMICKAPPERLKVEDL